MIKSKKTVIISKKGKWILFIFLLLTLITASCFAFTFPDTGNAIKDIFIYSIWGLGLGLVLIRFSIFNKYVFSKE